MRAVALLVTCVLGVTPVLAQPGASGGPAAPPQPPAADVLSATDATAAGAPVTPSGAPDPRSDAAWQLYHAAFAAVLRGEHRRAAELVAQLQREHPGHPAASLSMRTGLVASPGVADAPRSQREQPTSGARAELALFQTLHGIVLGVELCVLAECDSAGAFLGLPLVTGSVAAVASLQARSLTSGQRALINSGTAWGAANAGLLLFATDPADEKGIVLTLIAGQAIGLGVGAALMRYQPTAGQVGITNSGGQWSLALTGLTLTALSPDISSERVATILLVAMDAGLGVGAYLAKRFPTVTRAQGLVIDAAGIVGGVGGAGLGVLVAGSADERTTPALAAAGAVVGLGAAAYLTRNWGDTDDSNTPPVRAMILPVERGRGATAGIALTW